MAFVTILKSSAKPKIVNTVDLQIGQIGEITSTDYPMVCTVGDIMLRIDSTTWVNLSNRNVWNAGTRPTSYKARILQPGEEVTLTVQ